MGFVGLCCFLKSQCLTHIVPVSQTLCIYCGDKLLGIINRLLIFRIILDRVLCAAHKIFKIFSEFGRVFEVDFGTLSTRVSDMKDYLGGIPTSTHSSRTFALASHLKNVQGSPTLRICAVAVCALWLVIIVSISIQHLLTVQTCKRWRSGDASDRPRHGQLFRTLESRCGNAPVSGTTRLPTASNQIVHAVHTRLEARVYSTDWGTLAGRL